GALLSLAEIERALGEHARAVEHAEAGRTAFATIYAADHPDVERATKLIATLRQRATGKP
ncbi:MAG TPA: hypothetical protein VG755_35175, partial [Nannocystaceae bacterium]|nr:hypothetical protein [Nannocystaceae bacterium]